MINRLKTLLTQPAQRPYRLFQIESSLDCTLSCVMCPWLDLHEPGAVMSREVYERIAAHFHLAQSVDLTGGGEPLRNPRLVEMIVAAKAAGCEVGFSSNATRLTAEAAEQLVASGLDWLSFSVDAAHAALYERIRIGARFNQVIRNIAGLRDAKQRLCSSTPRMMMVFVMMTGEQENFQDLPAYIELAHSLGVEQVIAKNLDVILKDGDDTRRLFTHSESPRRSWQSALDEAQRRAEALGVSLRRYAVQPQEVAICEHDPLHSLFFNWQGYISPCITLAYAEERFFDGQRVHVPCQRFGNILESSLEAIWDDSVYRQFRRSYEARLQTERHATLDQLLGGQQSMAMPPAPEGCRTCYYLYGV